VPYSTDSPQSPKISPLFINKNKIKNHQHNSIITPKKINKTALTFLFVLSPPISKKMVLEKRDHGNPELVVPTTNPTRVLPEQFKLCNKLLIFIRSKLFYSQGKGSF
jgi:hypothetical protein